MKLRIRGDSLRLRLTRSEITRIGLGESVSETTPFPEGAQFKYTLEPSLSAEAVTATYFDAQIKIGLPMNLARTWAKSGEVAIQTQTDKLFILIEKDFACLKPRENEKEDESDMYFNPNSLTGHCGSHL
jgi:hypothetical protein